MGRPTSRERAIKKSKQTTPRKEDERDERKRAEYWLTDDNALILSGLALQCRTLGELSSMLGIHPVTIKKWRAKYPEIKEAIDAGRDAADAAIIKTTFDDAIAADGQSRALWWKYRLNYSELRRAEREREEGHGQAKQPVVIKFDIPKVFRETAGQGEFDDE